MANAPPFADPDLRQRLIEYLTAVLPELGRKDRRPWAEAYVRGLLLEGERKSIEPMAKRLPDGNVQAMQHFIGKSPWPYEPVRRRLAGVLCAEMGPGLWIVDDTGFLKQGLPEVVWAGTNKGTMVRVDQIKKGSCRRPDQKVVTGVRRRTRSRFRRHRGT